MTQNTRQLLDAATLTLETLRARSIKWNKRKTWSDDDQKAFDALNAAITQFK